jgi:hypothetical protein
MWQKSRLIGTGILTAAVAVSLAASHVMGASPVSVRGNLTKVVPGPNLVPVANQSVSVTCGSAAQNTTTDSSGLYQVTFTDPSCGPITPVSTRTAYDGSILTRQVWVSSESRATIDLRF